MKSCGFACVSEILMHLRPYVLAVYIRFCWTCQTFRVSLALVPHTTKQEVNTFACHFGFSSCLLYFPSVSTDRNVLRFWLLCCLLSLVNIASHPSIHPCISYEPTLSVLRSLMGFYLIFYLISWKKGFSMTFTLNYTQKGNHFTHTCTQLKECLCG